ncbi:hypothetical protein [Asticcacaulis benevestitus]|uniref:Uncharacterized protein n=1 Tax=Asticcacaulis benevestitus DSM 16100 = ATCC BAA-896 TaxID=1121022 RepID=V4PS57_9CAUL|nr:hypothetical protein [Asticcacaulis benevestitus]ESQ88370.1 hypothetical protein ABENE_16090 [Asticcacaulis benevestitus DSM 16100 = ATCC BAA-896]
MLMRRNLIITHAGAKALYRNWLNGAKRNFDLLVVACGSIFWRGSRQRSGGSGPAVRKDLESAV